MKRTLALNFVFVLCFSLYIGCGDTEDANSVTNSNADSESIFSTEDVKFTEDNGESRYSIVRPKDDAEDDPVWQNSNNFQIDYVHIYQLDKEDHEVIYWKE